MPPRRSLGDGIGGPRSGPRGASPSAAVVPVKVRVRRVLKKVGRTLWNDKVAAAHTVFYLVAAALFLPIVAGLFLFLKDTADSAESNSVGLRSRAVQGLTHITSSSGLASDGAETTSQWETKVNAVGWSVTEIGLLDEKVTALSFEKIDNLQRGGLIESTADAYINYPEFKTELGLGKPYDFHLRLYPVVETRTNDPYGMTHIKDAHVAYVANLTSDDINKVTGEWTGISSQGQAEITALKALKLTSNNQAKGFDAKSYQPRNSNPLNNPSLYTNVMAKQGDVVGDTSMPYSDGSLPAITKSYVRWFAEQYLWLDPVAQTPRYDVVVFGSDADLSRWGLTDGSNEDVRQELHDYLKAGGSIIFLGNKNIGDEFVYKCTAANGPCLLSTLGAGAPVTTPDVTNQMLSVPNALKNSMFNSPGTVWPVCKPPSSTINERLGWIPVDILGNADGDCANTYFGATTSDRYGATGGTLIVSDYDVTAWTSKETSSFLANTIMYAVLRSAFLDYGPPIPIDAGVESAERLMLVETPTGDYLDTKIVFYLWKNDCTASWDTAKGDRCIDDRSLP